MLVSKQLSELPNHGPAIWEFPSEAARRRRPVFQKAWTTGSVSSPCRSPSPFSPVPASWALQSCVRKNGALLCFVTELCAGFRHTAGGIKRDVAVSTHVSPFLEGGGGLSRLALTPSPTCQTGRCADLSSPSHVLQGDMFDYICQRSLDLSTDVPLMRSDVGGSAKKCKPGP
ncbi:unnamed protein product [Gadus morhua 'NCC']